MIETTKFEKFQIKPQMHDAPYPPLFYKPQNKNTIKKYRKGNVDTAVEGVIGCRFDL